MTRNGQKISFTQLVKTTTTPIKRRNLENEMTNLG